MDNIENITHREIPLKLGRMLPISAFIGFCTKLTAHPYSKTTAQLPAVIVT